MSGVRSGFDNLDAFFGQVDHFLDQVEKDAQQVAAKLAGTALQQILLHSPQYTGDFVANWTVSYNTKSFLFRPYVLTNGVDPRDEKFEPKQKGDDEAIDFAWGRAQPLLAAAAKQPLGTSIWLSNSAQHDEPYAWKIENGTIDFRPVNLPGDRPVTRAAYFVRNRFKHIGKRQLAILSRVGA